MERLQSAQAGDEKNPGKEATGKGGRVMAKHEEAFRARRKGDKKDASGSSGKRRAL